MKTTLPIQVTLVLIVLLASCGKECDIMCINGGVETAECSCSCPAGTSGTYCQIIDEDGGPVEPPAGGGPSDPDPTCDILHLGSAWVSQATSQGPAGTHLANEVYWSLPTDCFLTGIGVNVASDDVKMMKLYYRKLEDDCTISSQMSYTLGPDPSLTPEKQFTAPAGHAITGLGLLVENNNVTRMKVYFCELIEAQGGGFVLGPAQSENLGNSNGLELMMTTSSITGVSTATTVLTGLGLRAQNSGIYQIEFRLGRLQAL
ncbi:MAG: hypothetical protein R2815_12355 [Flavobacteriales bacterium]